MRAGHRAAAFAAFSLCLALASAGAESPSSDAALPGVARALYDEARLSAGIGDWQSASAYIEAAIAQDPGDSDILYLAALSSVKLGSPYASALGNLDAALATARFADYSRRDASILKSELLVRERRWREALDALGDPGSGSVADHGFHLAKAKALALSGNASAFVAELGEDLRRFPDDPDFARLYLATAAKLRPSAGARALGDLIVGRLPRYAAVDAELPVLAAPLMADFPSRRDAVLAYRASGGASAAATLRALEYGIQDEASAAAELLSGSYPLALGDLNALMALAGSPAGREAVASALSRWSGKLLVDADSDGIYEGSFDISNGLVTSWTRDSRQEARIDERASFSEGIPVSVSLSRPGEDIRIEYSAYPSVSNVTYVVEGESRSYVFGPEAFSYAPLELRAFAGSGKSSILLPYFRASLDPMERASASSALSVERTRGESRELTVLDKGLPVSGTSFVGGRILSRRSYEKGRPVLEKIDADGDGRFETEASFAQDPEGAWAIAWTRTDVDGDGVFEYREQARFPYQKEWDFDGNGSVDARQRQLADGSTRKDFSSKLDGRLDESIVVKDGKIVSLSRNGAAVDLIPDSNPELTWIGSKKIDLGRNLPKGEGIFSYAGRRYTLIRIGAYAFAELIP